MADRAVHAARRASRAGDPESGLEAVVELRREVEALEAGQVRRALAQGWSWQRIARSLGVSKQAAHRKHAVRSPQASTSGTQQRQRLVITGESRKAVEYARVEAKSLGHTAVEAEHLLLGLLRQTGHASGALMKAKVGLGEARREVRDMHLRETPAETSSAPGGPLPVSPGARAGFEQALREAVGRGDGHLGPEHLLMALLRDRDGGAGHVLSRLGVPAGRLQTLLERAIAGAPGRRGESPA